jgi:hypothetical protein
VLLEAGSPLHERMDRLSTLVHRHRLDWPIVLKPDTGERGLGVHFPADADAARDYLERADFNVVAQALVGGAEFRVLYYRMPGEEAGHIVAITEKHLPEVTGDGGLTLEQLILSDDWAVSSARLFLRLHAGRLDWVPFLGQKVALTLLGTHTRGAIFHDGARLITPALEASMDRVSRGYRGFHVGSFDLRAPSADALMEGGPFTVLELEGVSSEALPVHDGRRGLLHVYRTLFAQWELAFEIGRRNRDAGARPATGAELLALLRKHRRATRAAQAAELAAPVS